MRQGTWVALAIVLAIVFMAMNSGDLNTVVSVKESGQEAALRGELILQEGDNILITQDGASSTFTIAFNTGTSDGTPTAGDCDSDAERGDMVLDTTNNRLYICNGETRGWDHIDLTD